MFSFLSNHGKHWKQSRENSRHPFNLARHEIVPYNFAAGPTDVISLYNKLQISLEHQFRMQLKGAKATYLVKKSA